MNFLTTRELIVRLRTGDEEAFRIIYEQSWSKLYRLCFYYTRSREDSEDMLMGIFLSLWNNREKVDIDNIDAYLVKAAKNQSFKYLLKQKRRREQLHLLQGRTVPLPIDNDSPERLLELKELHLHLHERVDLLPEKTRNIFKLNREHGLSYQEIAGSLGISVKTVEYHISKALSTLAQYLLIFLTGFYFFF